MTGMQNELREKILGSHPQIMVRQAGMSLRLEDRRRVVEVVREVEGVVAASAAGFTRVGIVAHDFADVLDLYGIDPCARGVGGDPHAGQSALGTPDVGGSRKRSAAARDRVGDRAHHESL